MRQLFISYARENKPEVEALVRDLSALGYQTWVDSSLRGGQTWWEEILRRIVDSDVFVAIVSSHTLNSVACKRELEWALALNKPVLPLAVERLPDALPTSISMRQVIDYSKSDRDAALALAGALANLPAAPPVPRPLPVAPPAPLSYLSDLVEQVGKPEPLTHDQQRQALIQLEPALRSPDAEERRGGRYVLEMFSRRDDLYADVDRTLAQLGFTDSSTKSIETSGDGRNDHSAPPPNDEIADGRHQFPLAGPQRADRPHFDQGRQHESSSRTSSTIPPAERTGNWFRRFNRATRIAITAIAVVVVAVVIVAVIRITTASKTPHIPTVDGMYTASTDNGKNFTITLSTVCDNAGCTAHVVSGLLAADARYANGRYSWAWNNPSGISCLDGSTVPAKQSWSLNPELLVGTFETMSLGPGCGEPTIKYENGFRLSTSTTVPGPATSGPSPAPPTSALPPMPIQTVTPAKLESILLSAEEINTLMGASHMELKKTAHDMDSTAPSVSDPNCFGSIYSAEKSVYEGSGWSAVNDQILDESDRFYVDQTAVAFPSAEQAIGFLSTSADKWKACGGRTVTTGTDGSPLSANAGTWTIGQPTEADGRITQLNTRVGPSSWACEHVLGTISNALIEVKACGHQVGNGEANRIVDSMMARASH